MRIPILKRGYMVANRISEMRAISDFRIAILLFFTGQTHNPEF